MIRIFERFEFLFCMVLIALYIAVNSVISAVFGQTGAVSFIVNTVFSLGLIALMSGLKRTAYYGLKRVRNAKQYLYFSPLLLLISVNLLNGFNTDKGTSDIIFHILTMLNIGFIEEIIFRGFLFKMMARDNVKTAIIVSSLTFGIGHIINLLNGAELIPTLLQVVYATATGYLFVIIFHKSGSLLPCIITHSAVNALSVFSIENTLSMYIAPLILTAVPLLYAVYINRSVRKC